MGAMKAIYTDIQELQNAALGDEDSFIQYIEETGWLSPTEIEMRERGTIGINRSALQLNHGETTPRHASAA